MIPQKKGYEHYIGTTNYKLIILLLIVQKLKIIL